MKLLYIHRKAPAELVLILDTFGLHKSSHPHPQRRKEAPEDQNCCTSRWPTGWKIYEAEKLALGEELIIEKG